MNWKKCVRKQPSCNLGTVPKFAWRSDSWSAAALSTEQASSGNDIAYGPKPLGCNCLLAHLTLLGSLVTAHLY
jgi:hypothetical protein